MNTRMNVTFCVVMGLLVGGASVVADEAAKGPDRTDLKDVRLVVKRAVPKKSDQSSVKVELKRLEPIENDANDLDLHWIGGLKDGKPGEHRIVLVGPDGVKKHGAVFFAKPVGDAAKVHRGVVMKKDGDSLTIVRRMADGKRHPHGGPGEMGTKVRHLMEAAKHLDAAGMKDVAGKIRQQAHAAMEQMKRMAMAEARRRHEAAKKHAKPQHPGHHNAHGHGKGKGGDSSIRRLGRAVGDLHRQMRELHEQMRHMRKHMEHLTRELERREKDRHRDHDRDRRADRDRHHDRGHRDRERHERRHRDDDGDDRRGRRHRDRDDDRDDDEEDDDDDEEDDDDDEDSEYEKDDED